jgi:hypothetical protein
VRNEFYDDVLVGIFATHSVQLSMIPLQTAKMVLLYIYIIKRIVYSTVENTGLPCTKLLSVFPETLIQVHVLVGIFATHACD